MKKLKEKQKIVETNKNENMTSQPMGFSKSSTKWDPDNNVRLH
jgi:hypothetical protein